MATSPYYLSAYHPPTAGSSASHLPHGAQLHSPVSLPTDVEADQTQDYGAYLEESSYGASPDGSPTHMSILKSSKRKRTASLSHTGEASADGKGKPSASSGPSAYERKKVTRACDSCKTRKTRCSGTQPCDRCLGQSIVCEYNAEHRRGKPSSPPRLPHTVDQNTFNPLVVNQNQLKGPIPSHIQRERHGLRRSAPSALVDQSKSTQSSQEPDETSFEGHYIGPTSGIAFLYRAQSRFRRDIASSKARSDNGNGHSQSIFTFGDNSPPDVPTSKFVFPSRAEAKRLLERYFDFAIPTYRFLHRPTVESWLERLCDEHEGQNTEQNKLPNGKAAVVLMVLGTASLYKQDESGMLRDGDISDPTPRLFLAEAERKLANETGPVRLESVQARLAQCLYLLGSSRINQAWYIFGTTTQLIIALGLHRQRYSQLFASTSGMIELECRKRVFWCAYTLDTYLSIILGRPRTFRDEDVDQQLPQRLNDNDLTFDTANPKLSTNQCVSDGPVFHAKLAKILGGISSDLYSTSKRSDTNWAALARKRTAELKEWKESLPPFLDPSKVDPSILIPIFQRQSTVLSLAYAHAILLANRPSLLSSFADLSRPQDLPDNESGSCIVECIDAAFLIVDTVNGFMESGGMYRTFWFTHYISFCAIATLYVYTIQQSSSSRSTENVMDSSGCPTPLIQSHFEAAEKCQQNIAKTTAKSSPFRRYNIILDELKQDVLFRLGRLSTKGLGPARPVSTKPNTSADAFRPVVSTFGGARVSDNTQGQLLFPNPDFGALGDERLNNLEQADAMNVDPLVEYKMPFDSSTLLLDDSMLDLNLFGPQGELVGWSEFDSWAIGWPEGPERFEIEGFA